MAFPKQGSAVALHHSAAGARGGDEFGQLWTDIKMMHFSILPATPARQSCPERGPAGIMQWIRVTFPSSKADVAQWIWAPFSSQNRDREKRDTAHEFPHEWLKEGEIRHEEQTESLVWQSPLPLHLNLTCFYIHRKIFNKNPFILIANISSS